MTPRKQMVLKAKLVCPTCSSAKIEPLNRSADGVTVMCCRSCGMRFDVMTEAR